MLATGIPTPKFQHTYTRMLIGAASLHLLCACVRLIRIILNCFTYVDSHLDAIVRSSCLSLLRLHLLPPPPHARELSSLDYSNINFRPELKSQSLGEKAASLLLQCAVKIIRTKIARDCRVAKKKKKRISICSFPSKTSVYCCWNGWNHLLVSSALWMMMVSRFRFLFLFLRMSDLVIDRKRHVWAREWHSGCSNMECNGTLSISNMYVSALRHYIVMLDIQTHMNAVHTCWTRTWYIKTTRMLLA